MKTHQQIAELSRMNDEFYKYLRWTEVLFYCSNVLREMKFFFDSTNESELTVRLEDIEQSDPTRRIFFDLIDPEELDRLLGQVVKTLNQEGFPTEVVKGTVLRVQRGQAHRSEAHSQEQLNNNRLVPKLRQYFSRIRN